MDIGSAFGLFAVVSDALSFFPTALIRELLVTADVAVAVAMDGLVVIVGRFGILILFLAQIFIIGC